MIVDNRKRERTLTIKFIDVGAESPYELDNLVDEIKKELGIVLMQRKIPQGIKIKAELN